MRNVGGRKGRRKSRKEGRIQKEGNTCSGRGQENVKRGEKGK